MIRDQRYILSRSLFSLPSLLAQELYPSATALEVCQAVEAYAGKLTYPHDVEKARGPMLLVLRNDFAGFYALGPGDAPEGSKWPEGTLWQHEVIAHLELETVGAALERTQTRERTLPAYVLAMMARCATGVENDWGGLDYAKGALLQLALDERLCTAWVAHLLWQEAKIQFVLRPELDAADWLATQSVALKRVLRPERLISKRFALFRHPEDVRDTVAYWLENRRGAPLNKKGDDEYLKLLEGTDLLKEIRMRCVALLEAIQRHLA